MCLLLIPLRFRSLDNDCENSEPDALFENVNVDTIDLMAKSVHLTNSNNKLLAQANPNYDEECSVMNEIVEKINSGNSLPAAELHIKPGIESVFYCVEGRKCTEF